MKRNDLIKGKSGQFFLIAGLIISIIIIGIIAVSNYSIRESDIKIQDLRDEIKIESSKVIDYSLDKQYNQAQRYNLLVNLTNSYVEYQSNKDVYFIFGDLSNMTVAGSQEEDNSVSLNGNTVTNSAGNFVESFNLGLGATQINLSINNDDHIFQLNTGQNFYFVVKYKEGNEEYVIEG